MQRREFIRGLLAGVSATVMMPFSAWKALAKKQEARALAIPPLLTGEVKDGVRVFGLEIQNGKHQFFAGQETPTLGINGAYLGPTLVMRVGEKVRLNVTNNLDEPTTLHWHGIHLPAKADGGPHQVIEPGATWSPEFLVKQEASTFWYHSHLHKKTGEQVWRGLAGVLIIKDDKSDELELPQAYGIDDIPLVLQERSFYKDGRLAYVESMHSTMMGMAGEFPVVNGVIDPVFKATTQKVRLRILNGSNAGFFNLGFDDDRTFYQIGGDGSLLPERFETRRMLLGPGERGEIVVDVSDGQKTVLRSMSESGAPIGGRMMRMMGMSGVRNVSRFDFLVIQPEGSLATSPDVPEILNPVERLSPSAAVKVRRFDLAMNMGPMTMMGIRAPMLINGKAMDMKRIDEVVKLGDTEIWEIRNNSALPHPFHIHDIQFQILDRNGKEPHPGERGLKDTVTLDSHEVVRVIAKFQDYADPKIPYMYHCHILEHEDAGMMGQFTVVA